MPPWLPQALGYAASVACVAWVLHGYSIKDELVPAIRQLDWRWVSVALLCDLAVFFAQAWRWNTLLAPVALVKRWRTAQAIFIGQFANQALPLRPGELIRCYMLAHWNGIRLSLSIASAALERLIDGFWLVVTFLVTAAFVRNMPDDLTIGARALIGLMAVGAGLLLWVVFHKQHAHAILKESRWASTARHVVEGLHLMGNGRTLGLASLQSLVYLGLQILTVWLLMKADALDLGFWSAAGIVTIIRLAIVIPNGPANLGLIQVACVLAMGLFDVERTDAKNFSNIMLAAETIPLLAAGAVAVALTGFNIRELGERAKRGAQHLHTRPKAG
ncbi:MAG TPA: lysylphosphatidylglycerol synthase transmembrane domain-containing protein [Bryobacteraceae bacterium]|nr:lysylphosphatidylglycerol synthase transmembrane domain-containing protein [Bryobacteraceae bacterium]